MKSLNILSFGSGTQSTAFLLLYLNGKIDVKFDYIIFADVGFDKPQVQQHLKACQKIANDYDVTIHVANYKNLKHDLESFLSGSSKRVAQIPFYTMDDQGKKGILLRQCTGDYKIWQVHEKIRELENIKTLRGYHLNTYLGISIDEFHRAKSSNKNNMTFFYPLIDLNFDRLKCILYVEQFMFYQPPSSECYMCPFQDDTKWLNLKQNDPELWEEACKLDEKIRNYPKINSKAYLHKSCKPLREANLQENQISMFDDLCGGFCGL